MQESTSSARVIVTSEMLFIRLAQQAEFQEEIQALKSGIILPRNHQITKVIIKDSHEKNQHGGTNQVLAHLSSRYWVVSAREANREWEKECVMCRRRKVPPAKQVMAPLPDLRTQQSLHAFSQTSIDFAGPFYTKLGRGKTRHKRYLCLFKCLGTRAVHLEVAY